MPVPTTECTVPRAEDYEPITLPELTQVVHKSPYENNSSHVMGFNGSTYWRIGQGGDHFSGTTRLFERNISDNDLAPAVRRRRYLMASMLTHITFGGNNLNGLTQVDEIAEDYQKTYPEVSEAATALHGLLVRAKNDTTTKEVSRAHQAYLAEDETIYVVMNKNLGTGSKYLSRLAGFAVAKSADSELAKPELLLQSSKGEVRRAMPGMILNGLWIKNPQLGPTRRKA